MKRLLLVAIRPGRGVCGHVRRCLLIWSRRSLSAATSRCTGLQLHGMLLGRQRWDRMVDLDLFKSNRQSNPPW